MFDREKFKRLIGIAVSNQFFNGKKVSKKEDIYYEIADKTCLTYSAVISYMRKQNGAEPHEDTRNTIEDMFGLKRGALRMEYIEEESTVQNNITDFNKSLIFNAYVLLKGYLHSDTVEDEETYCEMMAVLDTYKVAIPAEVYDKIYTFAEETLGPIVYDHESTFSKCYTKEIGAFENDSFKTNDIDGTRAMITNFVLRMVEIERDLDDFAMRELHPYLV